MRYHRGDSPNKRESRSVGGSTERPRVPNLSVWSDIDSIERRKLQLYAEAIIRAYEVHRHLKTRRAESNTLGNFFRSGGAR